VNEKRRRENSQFRLGIFIITLIGIAGFIYDSAGFVTGNASGHQVPFLITFVCVICAAVLNRFRAALNRIKRPEDITGFPP
jgi:hypothetical protein